MNPTGYRPDGGINWNTFSPPGGVAPSAYGPSVMDATGGRTYAPVNPPQGSSAGALPQGYLMGDGTYAPDGVDTPDELSAWLGDAGQSGMRYGAAGPAPYREGAFNPQSVDYSPWDQAQRANEAIANQADTRATAGLGQQLQDMGLGASGASALAQGNLAGQQGLARNQRLGEAAVGRSRFGLAARGQQFGEYAGQRGQGLAEWQAGDASRYRNRLLARSGAPPWSTLYQMGGGRIT